MSTFNNLGSLGNFDFILTNMPPDDRVPSLDLELLFVIE